MLYTFECRRQAWKTEQNQQSWLEKLANVWSAVSKGCVWRANYTKSWLIEYTQKEDQLISVETLKKERVFFKINSQSLGTNELRKWLLDNVEPIILD